MKRFALSVYLICASLIGLLFTLTGLGQGAYFQPYAREFRVVPFPNVANVLVNGSSTSNYTSFVSLPPNGGVGLMLSFKAASSSTANVTVNLAPSVDGVTVATSPSFTWVVPANGTTTVNAWTNYPWTGLFGNAPYIAVTSIANAGSVQINTLTITASTPRPVVR